MLTIFSGMAITLTISFPAILLSTSGAANAVSFIISGSRLVAIGRVRRCAPSR